MNKNGVTYIVFGTVLVASVNVLFMYKSYAYHKQELEDYARFVEAANKYLEAERLNNK